MKRKYVIGISVLVVLLCLGLTMCAIFKSSETDKDELKDSDYITGTSDKFDDFSEDSDEEDEVVGSDSSDNAVSNTDNSTNSETSAGSDGSDKNNNTTDSSGNNIPEQDKEWTGFY